MKNNFLKKTLVLAVSASVFAASAAVPGFADEQNAEIEQGVCEALLNISAATAPFQLPVLPKTVIGLDQNGETAGEFAVTWESIERSMFASVGSIVVVQGSAVIDDSLTLPVTCSVRVAEASYDITGETNAAPAAVLSQSIEDPSLQSDELASIVNGNKEIVDNTSERWSNYNNRNNSNIVSLSFSWDAPHQINSADLVYYWDNRTAVYPAGIWFEYSMDGTEYSSVGYEENEISRAENGLGGEYVYTFTEAVEANTLRITFLSPTNAEGEANCVALIEAELEGVKGTVVPQTSSELNAIYVDGTEAEEKGDSRHFTGEAAAAADEAVITADAEENAAYTVLPAVEEDDRKIVRVVTVSEDGNDSSVYEIEVTEKECLHKDSELRNAKEASCTEDGYSGDLWCNTCQKIVQEGESVPAFGHAFEVRNAVDPTCTEDGYSGDYYCARENAFLASGYAVPARGHYYAGEVTKPATCKEDGVLTYRCNACDSSYTEVIPKLAHAWDNGTDIVKASKTSTGLRLYRCGSCGVTRTEVIAKLASKMTPSAGIFTGKGSVSPKIKLTGFFREFTEKDECYEVVSHGIIFIQKSKLGNKELTIGTAGRTNVSFKESAYKEDGSFSATFTARSASSDYVARAYIRYIDEDGNYVYTYSRAVTVNYKNA
ncbi:MAG: hypothetical protein Q4B22_00755 [Eubacteriales bacterium]|nr:hypothetical protein [Eubacteriales bacterium]